MTRANPLDNRCILVVEDNYILAMDICEWLEAAGASVAGPAPDPEQAFAALSRNKVNLAVIDINLGHGPTFEIAERLSREKIPFLFATGYEESAIPEEFVSAPRIEKPFKGGDLVGAVLQLQDSPKTEFMLGLERPV